MLFPAALSLKVAILGQWTDRTLFSDSYLILQCFVLTVMSYLLDKVYPEQAFKIKHFQKFFVNRASSFEVGFENIDSVYPRREINKKMQ